MALRARLTAPADSHEEHSRWHKTEWSSVSSELLSTGSRRFEAEVYLSTGYQIRQSISGLLECNTLGELADVWQPNRLKGILVPPGNGTPFLTATQVFDIHPKPRKWVSANRTPDFNDRFLDLGQIVVTCSGAVGRTTLATQAHSGIVVSHDLLRVDPKHSNTHGWIYACLRSQKMRSVMTSTHYGHIIKHLEIEHLNGLPIPNIESEVLENLEDKYDRLLQLRNRAHERITSAYKLFEEAMGGPLNADRNQLDRGFSVSSEKLFSGRRRLEGAFHTPYIRLIEQRMKDHATNTVQLKNVSHGVWWLPRFKRSFGSADNGVPYMSADELFTVNPNLIKKILVDPNDEYSKYYVEDGWILMACSGQTYGMLGSSILANKWHEQFFFSHDLIRIVPNHHSIRSGYLHTALSHPTMGRPALLREAYGTSIPHLEPTDIENFVIPRFGDSVEDAVAKAAEEAKSCLSEANELDEEMASDADRIINTLLGRVVAQQIAASDV